jgi:hypothetical protein
MESIHHLGLPTSMVELSEVIGLRHALAIAEAAGGTLIRIPLGRGPRASTAQRLQSLIGEAAYVTLVAHYGGCAINVPRCVKARRLARNWLILSAYDEGQSVTSLAKQYALTERQIRTILNRSWDQIDLPGLSIQAPGQNSE